MPVHKGYSATIYAPDTSGDFSTQTTGEPTTDIGGNSYQITNSARRLIDFNQAVAVYDDGSPLGVGAYSIDYMTGTFTLTGAPSGAVTADYYYLPDLVELGQAHSWNINAAVDALEKTDFAGDSWKQHTTVLAGWDAGLSRYYLNSYFWDQLCAPRALLFKFYIDAANGFWGWGSFTVSVSTDHQNLVGESINITGVTNLSWF